MSKRLSFINFKGGVGKTTLAFQVGCYMASQEKRTLLCDVDHQSSLSITCLGGNGWSEAVRNNKTIDQIFKSLSDSSLMPSRDIIHHPTGSLGRKYRNLDVVPSALSLDETEIELTSTNLGSPIDSEWNKRTLLCEWLQRNSIDEMYDYIIFDCPPATKVVTQNALAASHAFVVPTIPDSVSVRGTPHLTNQMMNKIEKKFSELSTFRGSTGRPIVTTFVPHRVFLGIVTSRAKRAGGSSGYTNDATSNMASLRSRYQATDFIKPIIKEGVGVSESMTAGLPVYDYRDTQNIGSQRFPQTFTEISKEIIARLNAI